MNLRKDTKSKMIYDEGRSLRERASKSRQRRKKELRSKVILINSGLALIIIMVILVWKVVSINSQGGSDANMADAPKHKAEAESDTSQNKKDKKQEEKASPSPAPTEAPSGQDMWLRKDLDSDKPMVALTFDDGPYAPVTEKILKVLEKYNARATFFCVGNRIPSYTEVVKKAYSQGCQIASHTYEHKVLNNLKKNQINAQIKKTDRELQKVVGCSTTALRPPGGFVNDRVKKAVKIPMVCWNVDSEDWKSRNTKKVLGRCRTIEDGDIVLMHDLYPTTAKAVTALVPQLHKKGFQMVTVDELFYYKGIKAEGGTVYYSGK